LLIPSTLSVHHFWRVPDHPPGATCSGVCLEVLHRHDILPGKFTVFFMQTSREPPLYFWSAPLLWLISDPFIGLRLGLAVAVTFATIALIAAERCHSATLIVNLPGSPRGGVETLTVVAPVALHAVEPLRETRTAERRHRKI